MAKRILKSKGRTVTEAVDRGLRTVRLPRESVEIRVMRKNRKALGFIPWSAVVYIIYDPLSTVVSLEEQHHTSDKTTGDDEIAGAAATGDNS